MSEYIITANNVEIRLKEFIEEFENEAEIINEAKCILLNYGVLEDYDLKKGRTQVSNSGSNYIVEYNGTCLYLEVEDNLVVDFDICD